MITTVIGKATPTAPPIIKANADNKFASACTSYPDMPLLHGSPAPEAARWMRTVKKRLTDGIGVYGVVIRVARSCEQTRVVTEPIWLPGLAAYMLMVKKITVIKIASQTRDSAKYNVSRLISSKSSPGHSVRVDLSQDCISMPPPL